MFAKKALAPKEKEPFFRFEKAAFRRIGVILRLIAIPVAIVGIILAIVLPTVSIEYLHEWGLSRVREGDSNRHESQDQGNGQEKKRQEIGNPQKGRERQG